MSTRRKDIFFRSLRVFSLAGTTSIMLDWSD